MSEPEKPRDVAKITAAMYVLADEIDDEDEELQARYTELEAALMERGLLTPVLSGPIEVHLFVDEIRGERTEEMPDDEGDR